MKNQDTMSSHKKILVVGGGIGGIRAAMDLAESGRDVVLIDKSISIGGLMTQLDRTFPTNNCDLCTISPRLSEGGRQERIELMTMTEVKTVSGEKGNFTVTLSQAPRYIDLDRCTACGDCYKAFPECVTFSPGLDHRAPTCMRYPQAIPQAYAIDMQKCQDVEALENICKAGAILPQQELKMTELDVGAVILCPGAAIFDPSGLDHFEYEKNPDLNTKKIRTWSPVWNTNVFFQPRGPPRGNWCDLPTGKSRKKSPGSSVSGRGVSRKEPPRTAQAPAACSP